MIMARINLKDKSAEKSSLILVFEANKKRTRIYTGISIPTKYWNSNAQQARAHKEFAEAESINLQLKNIKAVAYETEEYFRINNISATSSQLSGKYHELLTRPMQAISSTHFWSYFDRFVEAQKEKMASVVDYDKALRKHLLNAEKWCGIPLNLISFKESEGFVQKFNKYLFQEAENSNGEKGMFPNSVGKQMKNLKVFLKWCFKNEFCSMYDISHIVKHQVEVDNVYLTNEEIKRILSLDLTDESLSAARDLFVLGCETGLRWSDFSRILPDHITAENIIIFQKKTRGKISIPINSRIRSIISKYNGCLPNYRETELTSFNEKVREVCRMAQINDDTIIQVWSNNKQKEKFQKKFELVSSHTCRRSFCTNRFLAKTIPVKVIMAISGHKTEKSFMKYLKLSDDELISVYKEQLMA